MEGVNRIKKEMWECPDCRTKVWLVMRSETTPHFRHQRKSSSQVCLSNSKGETEEHRKGKLAIRDHFKKLYPSAQIRIEPVLPNGRRPDIVMELGEKRLAVEFQHSSIPIDDLEQRTKDLQDDGFAVLWIFARQQNHPLIESFATKSPNGCLISLNVYSQSVSVVRRSEGKRIQVPSKDLKDCVFSLDGILYDIDWSRPSIVTPVKQKKLPRKKVSPDNNKIPPIDWQKETGLPMSVLMKHPEAKTHWLREHPERRA